MKNLEIILQKYYKVILIAIFVTALILRWLYLPQKAISFAFDQARDAFVVSEMLHGNFKILGPSVSGVPGLYHGVLYYYVIALPYYLGGGNPVYVAYFLSFISSFVVFLVFYLSFLLTKKYTPSLISALIFAFSFEATQYANLLTNASMGVWFVPIIYIAIILESPILLGIAFGLSVQSEVALLYHLIPIVFLTYKKFSFKKYIIAISTFLVAISTMLISEVKFGFGGVKGAIYLLNGHDGISGAKLFSDYISTVLNQLSLTFSYTLFPINVVFGGVLGLSMIYLLIKTKDSWSRILLWYIFAFAIALPFGGWNMKHILVGVAPAVAVLTGIIMSKFVSNKLILCLILFVVLGSNLFKTFKENINGQTIFPLQQDLVLSKEIEVVDYTYSQSKGNAFSISTLTSPLFVNTLWSYLYNWYGKGKYGYLPSFIGHDQIGQLGDNLKSDHPINHFYIQEPTYGIPEIYVQYARGDEESYSRLVESENFGQIKVESRNYFYEKK